MSVSHPKSIQSQESESWAGDRPSAYLSAIFISIVGISIFLGMPVITGALTSLGFSEQQVGWIAASELFGSTLASFSASMIITRVDRRLLGLIGLLVMIMANILILWADGLNSYLIIRFVAGLGGGMCYALGLAVLSGTHHTARNFSILVFLQVLVGGVELYFFPRLASAYGIESIYIVVLVMALIIMPLLPFIPREGVKDDAVESKDTETSLLSFGLAPFLCLAAVFFFYLTIGGVWAYIERVGVSVGYNSEEVGTFLSLGNILSLFACLVAMWLSERMALSIPLLLALGIISGILFVMGLSLTPSIYLLGVGVFFLFWNFIDIFQLGTLSELDHSGRFTVLVPAAQSVATFAGPAFAASVLGEPPEYTTLLLSGGGFTVMAFLLYAVVYGVYGKKNSL